MSNETRDGEPRHGRELQRGFHHSPRRLALEIGGVVAILGLGIWGGAALVRWGAVRAADALPISVDLAIGRAAAEPFAGSACGGEADAALQELAARFRPHVPAAFREFSARMLDDEQVNAFALPGGNLFVLRGLAREAKTTDEVAGVLAHEIGHAVLRHGVRRMAREAGLGLALALVVGSQESVVDTLISGAAQLQSLRFDRDEEREADRFGLDLCARAGIDPRALGEFLGRLPDASAGAAAATAWFSTHPPSAERRAELAALLRKRPPAIAEPPRTPLPSIERLRAACTPSDSR